MARPSEVFGLKGRFYQPSPKGWESIVGLRVAALLSLR
jgi:hypothetical protein